MSRQEQQAASDNPFSTRRIRPGAVPFIFPPSESAETLVERLRQHGWWGEIIGPHGSGKSTLLATLVAAIEGAGRTAVVVTLHDRQRRLPLDLHGDARLAAPAVVIVDGYEQLCRWSRFKLKRFCRRREIGLLVTAHEPMGFPTIFHTVVTSEITGRVVSELMRNRTAPFDAEDLADVLARHQGDLREVLFELYDWCEASAQSGQRERP